MRSFAELIRSIGAAPFRVKLPDVEESTRKFLERTRRETFDRDAAYLVAMSKLGKPVADPHIPQREHDRRRARNRAARATRQAQRRAGRV